LVRFPLMEGIFSWSGDRGDSGGGGRWLAFADACGDVAGAPGSARKSRSPNWRRGWKNRQAIRSRASELDQIGKSTQLETRSGGNAGAVEKLAMLNEAQARLFDAFKRFLRRRAKSNNTVFLNLAAGPPRKISGGARNDLDRGRPPSINWYAGAGNAAKSRRQNSAKWIKRGSRPTAVCRSRSRLSDTTRCWCAPWQPGVRGRWASALRRWCGDRRMLESCI